MNFYLEELHVLGSELSLAAHLADVSDELRALAERSPDNSPHRSGEPYRLAVSGIYARLTATALRLEVETTRRPVGEAAPYASVTEFKADLDVLNRSLIANNSGVIARGRLRLLRRAVDCFGFHLARLDIRQNSAVHERTVANPFATRAYSLHTTGFAFDIRRRYASRAQAAAFQFMLDRLQALNLIAWVREPGTIHITVSSEARKLLPQS